jgi:hypothetical protein
MKLIILIILIIIFVFYIKSLSKLESFSTEVKKNIVIHIVNYDNVNNYIDYDYFNNHILRFINSDKTNQYILKEIINVDYKNNLYNAYQHVSNKTYPAQTALNNPSNKIKEFVENDIDFFKQNAVPEDSKESEDSKDPEESKESLVPEDPEESVVPEDSKDPYNWILLNMLDKRNLDGNHINIIVLPKPSNITIGNCIITSLYDADDNKTYPYYPSDLPSKFMAIYTTNQTRVTAMTNDKPGRTDERNTTQQKISDKQAEYKTKKDQMNETVKSSEYIEAKQKYDANWAKIKELQSIDHNELTELNQYPNYINRDKLVYDTTCDGTDRTNCRTDKKYYNSQQQRDETKVDIKDDNEATIAELQGENDILLNDLHLDKLKNDNIELEELDTEIGELYGELANQKPDCNAIKQIQNLNKIQNNWKQYIKKFESNKTLKNALNALNALDIKKGIVYPDKTCNNDTICNESLNYVNEDIVTTSATPNKTEISLQTLPISLPTLGALYSSNTEEDSCKSGLTTNKGLAYINSSDYYLNTFKDSYI